MRGCNLASTLLRWLQHSSFFLACLLGTEQGLGWLVNMATETHYVLARKSVPESAKYSSPNHESMDWHGIYRDLLFRRGTINPPCTHLKAEDSTTSFCDDPTSGSGLRKSPGCSPNGDHDDQLDQNVALFVKDFLSESAKARNLAEYEVAVVSVASEAVSTKLCQPFSLCPIPQICISGAKTRMPEHSSHF